MAEAVEEPDRLSRTKSCISPKRLLYRPADETTRRSAGADGLPPETRLEQAPDLLVFFVETKGVRGSPRAGAGGSPLFPAGQFIGRTVLAFTGADMQLRIPASLIIFMGSYLPLSIILLAQDTTWGGSCDFASVWPPSDQCNITYEVGNAATAYAAVLTASACLILTIGVLKTIKTRRNIVIKESKHVPSDLMNYVLPYIVSFMGLDYGQSNKLLCFIIFCCGCFGLPTSQAGLYLILFL